MKLFVSSVSDTDHSEPLRHVLDLLNKVALSFVYLGDDGERPGPGWIHFLRHGQRLACVQVVCARHRVKNHCVLIAQLLSIHVFYLPQQIFVTVE